MSTGAAHLASRPGGGAAVDDDGIAARSPLQLVWRRLRRDRVALAALAFICGLALVALLAPLVVKALGVPGPDVQSTAALDEFGTPTGPSGEHPLGVDTLGRDVLARVVYGARVSLAVAVIATAIAVAIGVVVGMAAGYFRGWVDTGLSRLMDVLLAFPLLLLALGIASACSLGDGCLGGLVQPGFGVVVLVIALVNWTFVGRLVRAEVLSLREREFVEAARSLGASDGRILVREILPNLAPTIIVCATIAIPQTIVLEAALTFLGVGVQPPTASWGAMIKDATPIFDSAWWYMAFPGAALLATVLAFNLLGDGLRDALDPRGVN